MAPKGVPGRSFAPFARRRRGRGRRRHQRAAWPGVCLPVLQSLGAIFVLLRRRGSGLLCLHPLLGERHILLLLIIISAIILVHVAGQLPVRFPLTVTVLRLLLRLLLPLIVRDQRSIPPKLGVLGLPPFLLVHELVFFPPEPQPLLIAVVVGNCRGMGGGQRSAIENRGLGCVFPVPSPDCSRIRGQEASLPGHNSRKRQRNAPEGRAVHAPKCFPFSALNLFMVPSNQAFSKGQNTESLRPTSSAPGAA